MKNLFDLYISYTTPENYLEERHIGVFKSAEEADAVTKKLTNNGGAFSNPDCKAHISEVEVVGEGDNIECVYRFYGQNIDSAFDGDLIESPYYIDKSTAIQEFMEAKKSTPRQQWRLLTFVVGEYSRSY